MLISSVSLLRVNLIPSSGWVGFVLPQEQELAHPSDTEKQRFSLNSIWISTRITWWLSVQVDGAGGSLERCRCLSHSALWKQVVGQMHFIGVGHCIFPPERDGGKYATDT